MNDKAKLTRPPILGSRASKAKVLLWDLETTNLNANFGVILSAGWKWLGEKPIYCVGIDDFPKHFKADNTNDRQVVEAMSAAIMQSDVIVGHYSTRFDFPMLQTRRLAHGLQPLPPVQHIDTWRIAKYKMKLNSNRLATLAAFLEVEDKTPILPGQWVKAMAGHKKAIKYVKDHNRQDIVVLERVFERIRPLMGRNHPNLAMIAGVVGCRQCGHDRVIDGFHYSESRSYVRYRCGNRKCGAWDRAAKAEKQ